LLPEHRPSMADVRWQMDGLRMADFELRIAIKDDRTPDEDVEL
jgi:hypothetical protein